MTPIFTSKNRNLSLRGIYPFVLTFLFAANLAYSQDQFKFNLYSDQNQFLEAKNHPKAGKLSYSLIQVMTQYENGANLESDTNMVVRGNKILINAFAKSEVEASTLLNSLVSMGLTGGSRYKHAISGMFPFAKINDAYNLSTLRHMTYSVPPRLNVGKVTSQADQAMKTDRIRSAWGINGAGNKIGVLSDTYNALGGEAAGIASGDLPGAANPFGNKTPVEVLSDLPGGSDEGRAMIELIHDVAPGSKLAFHTAFGGFADFAQGIIDLHNAGCNIIVDDVSYFAEPPFQDGLIAQAAEEVSKAGTPYFSSAGNNADNAYEANFVQNGGGFLDIGFGPLWELHQFENGNYFQTFTLQNFQDIYLWLYWDDASIFASPVGPTSDLDVFVFNSDFSAIVTASTFDNIAEGFPLEIIDLFNTSGVAQTYHLFIGRFVPVPAKPTRIKYILWSGDNGYFSDGLVDDGTVNGHSNGASVFSVGAARYDRTPVFGVNPPLPESFTSKGGTDIYIDIFGNRLPSPSKRFKPDFTAPQGTNNTFFGFDYEGDGFPNFFGTSASAPHAAAMAALLNQQNKLFNNNQNLGVEDLRRLMKSTTVDMSTPGFDFLTGAGLVEGEAAIKSLAAEQDNTPTVPTMTEWGLFLFGFFVVILGLVSLFNLQTSMQTTAGNAIGFEGVSIGNNFRIPFERAAFMTILQKLVFVVPAVYIVIALIWDGLTGADIVFVPISVILTAYFIYLVRLFK